MQRGRVVFTFLTIMFFAALTCAFADTVTLKSGQKVEGKIVEKTDKYLKIDFEGVLLTYFQDEVLSIQDSGKSAVGFNQGSGLSFNPAYAPIDFAGLAKNYPVNADVKKELDMDPSQITASLPKEYQELIQTLQSNPSDISGALSKLPAEYRGIVEESMKKIPHSGVIKTKELKQE
ncbi:MAG: hypothetical protein FJZ12_02335 [Candidatus Omnitrophica bacterium]|nr:hypothetical protein [Candidatus Omnitrophota bacterium]